MKILQEVEKSHGRVTADTHKILKIGLDLKGIMTLGRNLLTIYIYTGKKMK